METIKTDIAVVGGGGAGLAAAVAAAEKGANVTVLEKRHALGGNSAMAGGICAAESPVQKRRLTDAPRDDLFKIAMDYAHWAINPRIVRAYVDKSGDTIRWLEEKGVNFSFLPAMYPNQVIRTMHIPQKSGSDITTALAKSCEELGVRLIREIAPKKLLTDEKGKVTGVLAATKEKELRITASSVIIASGGYGGNKELLKKYFPLYNENMPVAGLPLMGEGLIMAMELGAATEGLGQMHISGVHFPGTAMVNAVAQEPNTIWVNKNGERFADEGVTFDIAVRGNVAARQPEAMSYTLFDEQIKNHIIEEGVIQVAHSRAMPPAGTKLPELPKQLQFEADRGRIKISDSWDEIARWIGADPKVLKATIDEYNSFCDRGHDEIFVKDRRYLIPLRTPPYYAIKCYTHITDTMGGIKVNHHMEVLNHQDNPISGLYAAGSVCAGGWQSQTYCYVLAGSMFGFAINSGRIAGENAAKYILGK